jgi:hypothetical protein
MLRGDKLLGFPASLRWATVAMLVCSIESFASWTGRIMYTGTRRSKLRRKSNGISSMKWMSFLALNDYNAAKRAEILYQIWMQISTVLARNDLGGQDSGLGHHYIRPRPLLRYLSPSLHANARRYGTFLDSLPVVLNLIGLTFSKPARPTWRRRTTYSLLSWVT